MTEAGADPSPAATSPGWFSGWTRGDWIRFGVVTGAFLLLFSPALSRMVYVYNHDDSYSYGYFIPVVSLFYIYMNRERFQNLPRGAGRFAWLGVVPLVLGVLVYMFSISLNPPVHGIARLGMFASLLGLVVVLRGWRTLWAYAFPLGYLLLMFPLPKQFEEVYITLPLQSYATKAGTGIIEAVGIPVVREGNVIRVPAMDLLVEEACSGIHSLFSLTALSFAMVFLFEKRWWEKILLLAVTPPIAVLANVIRVASTGMLVQWVSPELAKGWWHEFQGLSVFLIGMAILLLVAWIIRVLVPPAEPPGETRGGPPSST